MSSGLPRVLLDGTEAACASKSALTLLTSALAAGVFPELMSQRSKFISLASLALGVDAVTADGELTTFVMGVL
jgi:hypothetical protein